MKRLFIILIVGFCVNSFAMQSRNVGSLVTPEDKRKLVTILHPEQIKANQTIVISENEQLTYAKVTVAPCQKSSMVLIKDFIAPRGRAVNFNDLLRRSYLILDAENTP